ncbi:MAG: hypothetical protein V4726_15695 [Verrucomicrobiota bacterium]
MSTEMMEQKLAELERRLAAVEAVTALQNRPQGESAAQSAPTFERKPKGSWEQLIGWSKDDDLLREAARLGAEWRAEANEEGK